MDIPQRLTLTSTAFVLDGGTIIITATDERGSERSIMLVQHAVAVSDTFDIPGRLHLDGKPVAVRSDDESRLLALLRTADIRYTPPAEDPVGEQIQLSPNTLFLGDDIKQVVSRSPEENIRELRDQVVDWVESPEYVSFASEAEQAR